ncbi:DUF433 domain-containing protein [Frankia sp. AgB1.9]|uniref:DUF433 domain-containing protein n=1 Tax=unclassified Frankia TaxID=2632575 RepID=UPI001934A829|nr:MULTISPECIES: DUF433 domain-containing protein [unclassified Frankia]MBL7490340.1 DUF433 domain-containing protein [Frankia sp. AgW1.1]MBL7552768.1 DUF433 domain-containing protein [Frankia sp. AgB1.9]MBL7625347.1 DUF433 domain-containing protein [Frankia sp. AgB1.8]
MAYTTQLAAALSGATQRQLSHWRRDSGAGPVLVPEISASPPRVLYSFRDLLALRTCVFLCRTVSLQRVRKAIDNLRNLGEYEHLSRYRLVSDGDTVMLVDADAVTDLVRKPGQGVLVVMSDVLEPFAVREGVVVPNLFHPRRHLEIDPETRGGEPVVAGTRVPYDLVAGLVRDGVPPEQVRDYYPDVSTEAARDATDFALYVDSYSQPRRGTSAA